LDELADFTPVNRISIGIQSFDDRDLHLLSRRHTAAQAHKSIKQAMHAGFKNISIDLIYGLPGMDVQRWQKNLDLAFSYEIRHLSAYHLTIEPGTAFSRMASRGLLKTADEDESTRQFVALNKTGEENGFEHYEISNLAREGYYSRHNTGYWQRKTYLGIGPAAHSYNIFSRQWNVPDIRKYIAAVNRGYEFYGKEELDIDKRYNEYLMVSLRTNRGVDLKIIQAEFGDQTYQDFLKAIATFVSSGHMIREGLNCKLTKEGWLISDYIISKLATE
jgi:oxygen-independent coproporphyrinogen-3 oxidase